jgi:hypothetical protein
MHARLGETLRALLEDLGEPEPDWQAIEQAWIDASLEGAGTRYEQSLRNTGVALLLRDAEQLGSRLRLILTRLDGTEPTKQSRPLTRAAHKTRYNEPTDRKRRRLCATATATAIRGETSAGGPNPISLNSGTGARLPPCPGSAGHWGSGQAE